MGAAHTLGMVVALLSQIVEVAARASTRYTTIMLIDTGEDSPREVPDHLSLIGRTEQGFELSIDVEGGRALDDTPFLVEARGTKGSLRLIGGHPFGAQAGDLKLEGTVSFKPPDAPQVTGGLAGAPTMSEMMNCPSSVKRCETFRRQIG